MKLKEQNNDMKAIIKEQREKLNYYTDMYTKKQITDN